MSERRNLPNLLPGVDQVRGERRNRRNEPITTRTNIRPLVWVRRPAGEDEDGNMTYTLWIKNPVTGGEALVAGPL